MSQSEHTNRFSRPLTFFEKKFLSVLQPKIQRLDRGGRETGFVVRPVFGLALKCPRVSWQREGEENTTPEKIMLSRSMHSHAILTSEKPN
jgi:hypothetical protein